MKVPKEGLIVSNLRAVMAERNLSVTAVARLAGVSRPTVRRWRDDVGFRLWSETLAKLCHGLHVSPGVLLSHIGRDDYLAMRKADRSRLSSRQG